MSIRILQAPAAAGKTQYGIDHIRAIRDDERLAPIWVILPDAAQVRAFRRRLAQGGGAFNVHVVTFSTLYAELLVLAGEALPRLDEPILHRLLRAIVDELVADGRIIYYTPLQDKPGFFQALRRVIRELKQARIEPEVLTTAVSDQSPRLQELAFIYDQYQQWLQKEKWADDEGRGWLAAIALEEQPDLCADWRLLVVDGFDEFNSTQLAVLGHLARQAQETMVTLTGAASPRLAHHRFARVRADLEETLRTSAAPLPDTAVHLAPPLAYLEAALFEPTAPAPPPAAGALTLLELPNRAQEVRTALRWLKQRHVHDGVPLDQLAVLARDLETYRPFLTETAAEFGLPLNVTQGTWLHQNPAVAALLDLLALPRLNWPRRLLLEAWRSPYFDWSNQYITPADADLLAAAAREGQIIAGLDQWHEVLNRLAQASPKAKAGDVIAEEMDETAVLTAPRGPQAAALQRKLDAFVARLRPEPQATLRHYVHWLESLIGDDPALAPSRQPWQLGGSLGVVNQARYDPDGTPLPTAERDVAALQRLKDVLRSLVFAESALGEATPLSYPHFWQELRGAVEAATYRLPPPKEQSTLLAAPVLAARGLSFHAVALLGLCEGEFPRQPPRDPLLREPDRELLAARGVALAVRDGGDEVTLFYEAVTRARRQLLATRAYLADDGQPWEPSPYWQQLQRRSQGEPVRIRSAALLPLPDAASEAEFLAALAAVGEGPTAVSYQDRLPEIAALVAGWQNVQAGAAVLAARMADQARGPYEGDLSGLGAQLARRYGPERPWSASRLESYAVCGFAFFAGYALGFDPRQPVAAGYDVRQLGNMYHTILEETYRRTAETGESASDVLPEIALREFDAAPETYGFRPTPLWQRQREELTHILLNTVNALDAASAGWQPAEMEPPFGLQETPPLELADDQGRTLRLRGYIDRVDVAENGCLRIIDYKSSHTPIAAGALAEGKRIQLALYALAARDALDLGEPVAGMYWHIGSAKPSSLRLEKQDGGIEVALGTAKNYALSYATAIRQGHFVPKPPDSGCPTWCPAADFCWRYTPREY